MIGILEVDFLGLLNIFDTLETCLYNLEQPKSQIL
jgi:hypothetical protein